MSDRLLLSQCAASDLKAFASADRAEVVTRLETILEAGDLTQAKPLLRTDEGTTCDLSDSLTA